MSSSDWSELRIEMLELIAKRLDLMHCYRFGATCKSCWSAAMSKCHQVPWLMLSKHDEDTDAYSFFSLCHQEDCSLRLTRASWKTGLWIFSWLLRTIDYQALELHLLNPFTRRQFKLPSPISLLLRNTIYWC
ncbi:hypothetical protein AAC387_Pa03g4326 [Persea americana]